MATGPEADELIRIGWIGPVLEVIACQLFGINQQLFRRGHACQGMDRHGVPLTACRNPDSECAPSLCIVEYAPGGSFGRSNERYRRGPGRLAHDRLEGVAEPQRYQRGDAQ